jgi:hypothetical protein
LHEKSIKIKPNNISSKQINDKIQLNSKELEVEINKLLRVKETLEQLSKMNQKRTQGEHSKKHDEDTYFSDDYEIEVAKQRRNRLLDLSFYEIKEEIEESEEGEEKVENNSEQELTENIEINKKMLYILNENPNEFKKHPKVFIRNLINGI